MLVSVLSAKRWQEFFPVPRDLGSKSDIGPERNEELRYVLPDVKAMVGIWRVLCPLQQGSLKLD